MHISIDVDDEEIKKAVIEKIAQDFAWKIDSELKTKMFNQINWSKMAPHIQERILRMAAEKILK